MNEPAQTEKDALEDATDQSMCMNWPPSRGPEPKWMTQQPNYAFPEPTLIDDAVRSDSGPGVPWYNVWAYVVDLLGAGPLLANQLVVGAELVTDEQAESRYKAWIAKHPEMGQHDDDVFKTSARTVKYLDDRPLIAVLSYPLSMPVSVRVEPFTISWPKHNGKRPRRPKERQCMTVGWLLWSLAKTYEMIYAEHEKYGIWGHSIRDLCFEQFAIDGDNVHLFVGS